MKLVHVGRLLPIEEALAALKGGPAPVKAAAASARTQAPPPAPFRAPAPARPGPSPLERDNARKTAPPPEAGEWKDRLHATLLELGMNFTADAVEHSEVTEAGGEIRFVTPEVFRLAMDTRDLGKAVQQVAGKSLRLNIQFGTPVLAPAEPKPRGGDEVFERALAHPEVRRFQEMFPDAHVRTVRDLKEG